jgi:hypothetical protein
MRDERRYLRLDYAEHRLIFEALIRLRNRLIAEGYCADAVNGLLVIVAG